MTEPLLAVRNLSVTYPGDDGDVRAVRNASFTLGRERLGIVGESGSGKSTLIGAATRLLPDNAVVRGGTVQFDGQDMLSLSPAQLRALRGRRISMVFQDPMTALNPVLSIGRQMADIQYRDRLDRAGKRARAAEMLRRVGMPDPLERLDRYPHEFSGGMRQRIAIAMALLGNPDLLIADEPTTALDVTMEAQIIHLLRELRREFQGAILFISHNLGLIAELCDLVVIFYAGEVVERGPVRDIFHRPRHPYTEALLICDPARLSQTSRTLPTIGGEIPDLIRPPVGCVFAPRCPKAVELCRREAPASRTLATGHFASCHLIEP